MKPAKRRIVMWGRDMGKSLDDAGNGYGDGEGGEHDGGGFGDGNEYALSEDITT